MFLKPFQFILVPYYFNQSRFAYYLALAKWDKQSSDKIVWAYYRLGMYATVVQLPRHSSAMALQATAASFAACGNIAKSKEFSTLFMRYYATQVDQLVESLAPFNASCALDLAKKNKLQSLLVVALYIKNREFESARLMFEKLSDVDHKCVNYACMRMQLNNSATAKLEILNLFYQSCGLQKIDLKSKNVTFNVSNLTAKSFMLKSNKMLISILMTSYDASKYIMAVIESILAQTYSNFELIIVDDCSTDQTWDIIQDFCQKDTRVKAFRQPYNAGTYVAKNRAILMAKGELVMCHDADDWSHPQRLELQVQPLLADSRLIATNSDWIRVSECGEIYTRSVYPLSRLNPSSVLFRRQVVIDKMGFWDSVRTGADSEFLQRMKLVFGRKAVKKIKLPLAIGSHHQDSLMNAPETGFISQVIPVTRMDYWESWNNWHIQSLKQRKPLYVPAFNTLSMREYEVPSSLLINDQLLEYYQSLAKNCVEDI